MTQLFPLIPFRKTPFLSIKTDPITPRFYFKMITKILQKILKNSIIKIIHLLWNLNTMLKA